MPNSTSRDIIRFLTGVECKFQLVNKTGKDQKVYQNINFDSIRVINPTSGVADVKTISPDDIQWVD